jgi:V8-like Glu-specific endopeptidase
MNRWSARLGRCVSLLAISLVCMNSASADDGITAVQEARSSPQAIQDHWTPEMFFSSAPMGLVASPVAMQEISRSPAGPVPTSLMADTPSKGHRFDGSLSTRLFPKEWLAKRVPTASPFAEKDQGASKLPFTSSRLTLLDNDQEYPFRTIGRLFFTTPNGPAACTATVIAPRLVLTAGHCVHSGSPTIGFYSDFIFVPAYREGNAPFGAFSATAFATTATWASSKGKVPNAADYALLEIGDESGQRVGDAVGWLPSILKATAPNDVHIVGYPGAFDGGEIIHVVASSSSKKGASSTWIYGSDMTQGSSGGPWIMNLGDPANGQASGLRNAIVGVTSYLASGSIEGSSVLDVPLVQMFNVLCAHLAGNCS